MAIINYIGQKNKEKREKEEREKLHKILEAAHSNEFSDGENNTNEEEVRA